MLHDACYTAGASVLLQIFILTISLIPFTFPLSRLGILGPYYTISFLLLYIYTHVTFRSDMRPLNNV